MTQNPQAPKKSSSGCLIALAVVGGILAVCCLVGGIAMWRLSQTEEAQKVFGAVKGGVKMAQRGVTAPGAQELRDLGCQQGMVLDPQDVAEFIDSVTPDAGKKSVRQMQKLVMCQVGMFESKSPTCEEVAAKYVDTVGEQAAGEFQVIVQKGGSGVNTGAACQQHYRGKTKL